MVVPSCAVTTVVNVFGPTVKGRLADGDPDLTATPLTVMVAFGSALSGVKVTDVTPLLTDWV